MNRTKIYIKKTVKFIRELSVVVIGIAITVSVGLWINNINNKKDLNLYLDAIKLELEKNIEDHDKELVILQRSVDYANYLRANDKKSLNADTIDNYINAYYTTQVNKNKTNAFEMFKLSGIMRLMNDKELLLSIWEAYTFMDESKILAEIGLQFKIEEIKKELPLIAAGKKDFIPMYTYYTATDWAYDMHRLCQETSEILKETVLKLENRR